MHLGAAAARLYTVFAVKLVGTAVSSACHAGDVLHMLNPKSIEMSVMVSVEHASDVALCVVHWLDCVDYNLFLGFEVCQHC